MKKSQTLVVQFVIFVIMGLTFSLAAAGLLRMQSDFIKQDILDSATELVAEQVSANAIMATSSCKSCEQVSLKFNVKRIADYSPIIGLGADLTVSVEPENKVVVSTLHNLKYSVIYKPGSASTIKPINLTYEKTKNNLVVS
ncbi:MAG: hypothetical protein HYT70_01580 [Candidatus Aenigmarchaeota archaeon]|nr:hypothetical protein [Candidatus Aenigmarchaeota archaeon]